MTARMKNPASYFADAQSVLPTLGQIPRGKGVDDETLELLHFRVSQINGCAWCLDFGRRTAEKAGMGFEKLAVLPGWREATVFSDAQRAALELAEAMTRLSDRPEAVDDAIWAEAEKHWSEEQLAAIILWVATTNLYNRLNVTVKQVPGTW
ncbi:carboxymuconolactone decarboxylase family protein [Luteimicrobium sp. NPDC057192]|uniref:carboxymuconolactone decarboxylase family protein n=1 Tax=Luteimicrobium sp. NPDC057192 TaxID=3346042 RepID=UPI0036445240